jgi:hypothetical protein
MTRVSASVLVAVFCLTAASPAVSLQTNVCIFVAHAKLCTPARSECQHLDMRSCVHLLKVSAITETSTILVSVIYAAGSRKKWVRRWKSHSAFSTNTMFLMEEKEFVVIFWFNRTNYGRCHNTLIYKHCCNVNTDFLRRVSKIATSDY